MAGFNQGVFNDAAFARQYNGVVDRVDSLDSPDEPWRSVGAAGQPAFANGWTNYGGSEPTAAFYKDARGIVRLRGLIKSGVMGSGVFTLPPGYRPVGNTRFACMSAGALSQVYVGSNGVVNIASGSNTDVDLSPVAFRADA